MSTSVHILFPLRVGPQWKIFQQVDVDEITASLNQCGSSASCNISLPHTYLTAKKKAYLRITFENYASWEFFKIATAVVHVVVAKITFFGAFFSPRFGCWSTVIVKKNEQPAAHESLKYNAVENIAHHESFKREK